MDGDPRNQRMSLLKKYDIPVEHLSYDYAEKCSNKKELERIIRILRSGEEGSYPDLLKVMEERLRVLAPDSRVLRVETPILTKECLNKEEWDAVENELLCWEKEMNVMDKSLDFEKGRFEVVGNKNLPEVRKVQQKNILLKTPGNSKMDADNNNNNNNNTNNINDNNYNNKNNNNKTNNKRIKSGDYEAWDKFDVDKELLKLDVEEERQQELNEKKKREAKKLEKEKKIEIAELDKENYSSMEQQVLANQAKDRGNECYKSGDLASALKYYEVSIKLYPTANAYNNRAITYLKLKQYNKALEDCNKVLHLEKNNVKALHRRATAYQNMQNDKENHNYDELALHDLCEIIRLEPNNKAAQGDIQKLKKKLNIEDSGKKFRMPISDGSVNNINIKKLEEKNSSNIKDNTLSIDKLPLTYYGPSTSTFQCEPYSMVHRALSGSSIPGRVLCKCNSNIPRQNPLCQKCGEAMCTPKPSKAIKAKSEIKFIDNKDKTKTKVSDAVLPVKSENNYLVKLQSEVSEKNGKQQEGKLATVEDLKESENKNLKELGDSVSQIESKKPLDVTEKKLTSNTVDNSKKENTICEIVSKNIAESHIKEAVTEETTPSKIEEIKNTEVARNKNDTITAENNSSPNEVSPNVKKSKNKKKKSKENKESKNLRKNFESLKVEPVKVVYANKYLHPTSVEPKIKNEPSPDVHQESNLCSTTQFKAFVPNRKCYSTEYKRTDSSAAAIVPSFVQKTCSHPSGENNYDSSSEGNKENISGNSRTNSVDTGAIDKGSEEVKKEVFDSAFEFIRTWEELKKLDESYIKRAEIMRKIQPTDLSKVIGMKLDSDMLSCILECLLRHLVETEPKRVVELLKQLPQIPRFELVAMFLGDSDKKKMKKLIQAAEDRGFKLEEDIKKSLTAL